MLVDRITEDMKQAMKAGDKQGLGAIRMLRAAIKDKEIELGHTLSDDEVFTVIAKLVKQRRDSASQYATAGRSDLETRELAEAQLYSAYLPEQLSEEEISDLIEKALRETGATSMRDMGKVMAWIKPHVQGRVDMGTLSGLIKARLQPR